MCSFMHSEHFKCTSTEKGHREKKKGRLYNKDTERHREREKRYTSREGVLQNR